MMQSRSAGRRWQTLCALVLLLTACAHTPDPAPAPRRTVALPLEPSRAQHEASALLSAQTRREQRIRIQQTSTPTALGRVESELVSSAPPATRRRIVGARAQEPRFADYVMTWQAQVEETARRNLLPGHHGKLQLVAEVDRDGRLLRSEILRSSGDSALDAHAQRILQMAEPFPAFSMQVRRDTDVLAITRTWTFTQDKGRPTLATPKETP